jgi:DNA polymerase-4
MDLIDRQGLTLVGVALGNLEDNSAIQLAFPFDGYVPSALDLTVDDVRERFGKNAITRAVLLGRDAGLEVPLLPD